jgi:hypothetical protein
LTKEWISKQIKGSAIPLAPPNEIIENEVRYFIMYPSEKNKLAQSGLFLPIFGGWVTFFAMPKQLRCVMDELRKKDKKFGSKFDKAKN